MWVDEGMTACRDAWPIKSLLGFILHREMNQILYYLMVHAWTSIAGASVVMLRLPSVLFDIAAVPLIYVLGTELGDRRAGLIGALMLTLNASAIEYAQTARAYAMLVSLTILAAVFFVRSIKHPSRRNLAGYIMSGGCAVYAHMFGIFALPAQALFLLWYRPDWNTAKRVGLSIIAVGMLSLPAFFFGIRGYHGNIAWVPKLSVSSVVSLFGFFSGAFDQSSVGLSLALSAVYLTGIALAMVRLPRANRAARAFLLCSILVPVGLAIVISFFRAIFLARYLIFGLPFYVLLAALGMARLKSGFAPAMLLLVSIVSAAQVEAYYRAPGLQDWRGATGFIATHSRPSDTWIVYPDSCICLFSYYGSRIPGFYPKAFTRKEGQKNVNEMVKKLAGIGAGPHPGRVWLTFPVSDQLDLPALHATFPADQIIDETGFSGLRVVLFDPVQ